MKCCFAEETEAESAGNAKNPVHAKALKVGPIRYNCRITPTKTNKAIESNKRPSLLPLPGLLASADRTTETDAICQTIQLASSQEQ